jgi:phosphopantothenoylcysteine synthetase/decarboxylase
MSVRYSTPHVHYPQLNSSRVCLPTNFQKFKCHIFIACAAVSDYSIKNIAKNKIKKSEKTLILELTPTKDILQEFLIECNADIAVY